MPDESPMQIACPNCATSYRLTSSALGAQGRSVRCTRCLTVWFVERPEPEPEMAMAGPVTTTAAVVREEVVTDRPFAPQFQEQPNDAPQSDPAADAVADSVAAAGGLSDSAGTPDAAEADAGTEQDAAAEDVQVFGIADAGGEDSATAGDMLPVTDAPPVAPLGDESPPRADTDATPGPFDEIDIENFAARRRQRIRQRNPFASPGLSSAILLLLAVVGGLLIWRKDIVRLAPQTASFYAAIGIETNLRGLTFADIKTIKETQDGIPVLVVEGKIVSTAPRPVEVPRIRLAVRGSAGQEIYSWTALPPRTILPPGESLTFVSRLASPPTEAREVMVRFFNRRDAASGSR